MTASALDKILYENTSNSKMLKQMLPSMVSAAKYTSMPHNLVCYLQVYELHVSYSAPHIGIAVTVKWLHYSKIKLGDRYLQEKIFHLL
jgi:hypothetical protein